MMYSYVIVDSVSGEARIFLDRNDEAAQRGFVNSLKGHPFAKDMVLYCLGELPVVQDDDKNYLIENVDLICKGSDLVEVEDAV